MRFAVQAVSNEVTPVALPPGRLRLATKPRRLDHPHRRIRSDVAVRPCCNGPSLLPGRRSSLPRCTQSVCRSQIGRIGSFRPAEFQPQVLSFDNPPRAGLCGKRRSAGFRSGDQSRNHKEADRRIRSLLRARRERPCAAAPPSSVMNSRRVSFDHLVGAGEQRRRNFEAKGLRGIQIDGELEFGRLDDRQVGGLFTPENASGVDADLTIGI